MPKEVTDKLIEELIPNSMSEFKSEGHLRPVLCACVASLIMHDREVVMDFNRAKISGTSFIHAKLRQSFIRASVYDNRATSSLEANASNDMKAIATLNYWGDVIRKHFHESNIDFQPLTNESNSAEVVKALNDIAKSQSMLTNENIELRNEIKVLHATMESDRHYTNNALTQMTATTNELLSRFKKYSRMYNIPNSPPQHSTIINVAPAPILPLPLPPPPPRQTAPVREDSDVTLPLPAQPTSGPTATLPVQPASACPITSTSTAGGKRSASQSSNEYEPSSQKRIVENSNYQRSYGQGTDLQNIIYNAYMKNHFKSDGKWSFLNIQRDEQFNENAKFSRCLQLFEVSTSDNNKRKLEDSNLNATELSEVSNSIASEAMAKLLELEDSPQPGKQTNGYTGVGSRVRKVLSEKFKVASSDNKTTLAEAIAKGLTSTRMTQYYSTR